MQVILIGSAKGILLGEDIHILKRSSSSYTMIVGNMTAYSYCCQDGCCDRGLQADVRQVVETAKEQGATRVIIRTGQREYYHGSIAGLPVSDVSSHIGVIDERHRIIRR